MTIAEQKFLSLLMQLVDKNLSDCAMSSKTLSEEFCLSPRHFNRKVKAITGMDTTHFIRYRRVVKACALLVETDLPISEIYVKCGIESANYFSRIFKLEIGVSPTEYRNSNVQTCVPSFNVLPRYTSAAFAHEGEHYYNIKDKETDGEKQ